MKLQASAIPLLVLMGAAAAWVAHDFYDGSTSNRFARASENGCGGKPVGTIRINDNGSPQICLMR